MVQRPRLVSSYQKRWTKPVSNDESDDKDKNESQDSQDDRADANDSKKKEASLAYEDNQTEKKNAPKEETTDVTMRQYLDIKPLYG